MLWLCVSPLALAAQLPAARHTRIDPPPPSRAESLFAQGRLRAMEETLYADVARAPRAPEARGALGRYLASRGRFTIAEVLFAEALRFGADTATVAQALMTIAAYRPEIDRRRIPGLRLPAAERERERARLASRAGDPDDVPATVPATVPFTFHTDGRTLGAFVIRGRAGERRAVIDPRVEGITIARADDAALQPQRFAGQRERPSTAGEPLLLPEVWIGECRIGGLAARVDPALPADEVRVGMDVVWTLELQFDEQLSTVTVPAAVSAAVPAAARAAPQAAPASAAVEQIPFALGFPGLWLVPQVGRPPVAIESPAARTLLRGARWHLDPRQSTVVVAR